MRADQTTPSAKRRSFRRGWLFRPGTVLVVAIAIVIGGLLWQGVQSAREAARRMSCSGTLKFIGLAMHNYHAQHDCYPPAHLADKDGRPVHSWRVLVLRYHEADQLYREYSFAERWNSPDNIALARNVPSGMVASRSTYLCPSEQDADEMHATYLMLVGPAAFSDGPTGRKRSELSDGTSNTIMIAERSQSGIHWMEPRDLNVAAMSYRINDPDGRGMRSSHPGVANALFADGSVHSINENIAPDVLKAVITANAGDDGSEFHAH